MGRIKDATGSYSLGLLLIAGFMLLAMLIVLLLRHDVALERSPVGHRQPAE